MLLEAVAETTERDAQELGGLRAVTLRALERLKQEPSFKFTKDVVDGETGLRQRCQRSGGKCRGSRDLDRQVTEE